MRILELEQAVLSIPEPLFLVVEDVGWWQGYDGSMNNEPYRNAFPRRHCLADYQALARLAEKLSMRIAVGMVLGEWDRSNFLRDIPGATWMGDSWDNSVNQGPWLEEAADYLREMEATLEIAVHGICHEFWQDGRMQRSEFHDQDVRMRSDDLVRGHLDAYATLLQQNGFQDFPRLFIPPALHHSFGNEEESIQALLHDYGIEYVTTRFSRTRMYSEPRHPKLTWECGVGILERGLSPVKWDVPASSPVWNTPGPILPLHWGNLLHPVADRNGEIVDGWAAMLLENTQGLERILTEDLASCWRQAAAYYLAGMSHEGRAVIINLSGLPDPACFRGDFSLKIQEESPMSWTCLGAEILSDTVDLDSVRILKLLPEKGRKEIVLSF